MRGLPISPYFAAVNQKSDVRFFATGMTGPTGLATPRQRQIEHIYGHLQGALAAIFNNQS